MAIALARFWASTFDALQNRHYRIYWFHRLGCEGAMNLTSVAQGWLVYQLTGSALALGWVGAGRAVATLLVSPWGGVISDRYDKRSVLVWTRIGMALVGLGIAVLVSTGRVQVWHLAAGTLLNGVLSALMMGAQQSIVSDLVEGKTLMNAVSMNAVGLGITGMVFPSLSGVLVDTIGVGGVYYIGVGIYLATVVALMMLPAVPADTAYREPPLRALAEGVRYTARDVVLQTMIIVAFARFLLSMSYATYMPKFASEVLGYEAAGLGLLLSAPGVGALIASLSMAALRDFRHKGSLLLWTGIIMGGLLVGFGLARSPWLVFLLLILLGACGNILRVANQALLQGCCEGRYRGRVMSLYGMSMGSGPLLGIPMGALADLHGVPLVVGIQGVLLALVFGALAIFRPTVRRAR
jgi:MFS family permease